MCGITGVYNFKNPNNVSESNIAKMRDTLAHRGPDDAGAYVSPDKKVGLGARRLAIIDLTEAGHMPMRRSSKFEVRSLNSKFENQNSKLGSCITFNGEIYNFKELREELKAKGYEFASNGDTEVILAAYEEYGADCAKHLNGMFAFVIWDENKKIIFAARDHIGIKPFYYAIQNGTFYFGSEIKAILANSDFKKELDEKGFSYYLTFGFAPAPFTLFKDIKKLPAAHRLTVDPNGEIRIEEYWNPLNSNWQLATGNWREDDYVYKTKELIQNSIKMQMVSDVPFGCLLSGGIDSSLNAALMSKALGKPVTTFTIGSNSEKYDEFKYSRLVARKLDAKTHERAVNFDDFLNFLPQYAKYADDPNGDPTCFLVYYLSEMVRDSGTIVIQTGEGGDELFAGYDSYKRAAGLYPLWKNLEKIPGFLKQIPARFSESELARRLAAGEEPFWGHALAFTPLMKQKLLSAQNNAPTMMHHSGYELVQRYYEQAEELAPDLDFINKMAYLDLKMRLADFLLMRVDKMAMAHSVEARVPFLDYRIVELALQIPAKIKIKNGELKYVLKEVARGEIPDEVIDRKKQGFGAPVEEWFRDKEKSKILMRKIYGSKLKDLGILNHEYIRELHARHMRGENHTFRLMTLLGLSFWYDGWF